MKDNIKATGKVHLILTGPDGKIKQEQKVKNLVVEDGLEYISSRMKDATVTAMSHMAVGTSSTTPAADNAVITSEVTALRAALTSTVVSGSKVTYTALFADHSGTNSNAYALKNAGILNAPSGGVLLAHTTFDVITKAPLDTLTITWAVDLADT
ncbi:MAG TPA: hypothetical protein EYO74_04550 [Piscirickettsiaceae bacterium]|nr:hypothetical protein [Piscirickettsiaceae bacterium]